MAFAHDRGLGVIAQHYGDGRQFLMKIGHNLAAILVVSKTGKRSDGIFGGWRSESVKTIFGSRHVHGMSHHSTHIDRWSQRWSL
jgi:hypothetical protein